MQNWIPEYTDWALRHMLYDAFTTITVFLSPWSLNVVVVLNEVYIGQKVHFQKLFDKYALTQITFD